jgi:hypothetical protein
LRQISRIHVPGAGLDEQFRRCQVLAAYGVNQRRLIPDAVPGIDVGAAPDQEFNHVGFVLAGRDPQRGDADLILGVDVGSAIEGGGNGLGVAGPHSRPQGVTLLVSCAGRCGQKHKPQSRGQKGTRKMAMHDGLLVAEALPVGSNSA